MDKSVINPCATVAGGRFAPGHLGELTQQVPFEMVDAVLEQTCRVSLPCWPPGRPGSCYRVTDAVALMTCCNATGGFVIEHFPPDLAPMARMLAELFPLPLMPL